MYRSIIFSVFAILLFNACSSEPTTATDTATTEEKSTNQFGELITESGSISYDDLLAQLSTVDSIQTKVEGTVSAVCKKKGCWMTIVSKESDQEMRVKFKDYGFFVPKDIEGRKVIFEGKAFKDLTSVADLRHYAEDEGKSKEEIEKITTPEEDYNFLASGVLLLDKE